MEEQEHFWASKMSNATAKYIIATLPRHLEDNT